MTTIFANFVDMYECENDMCGSFVSEVATSREEPCIDKWGCFQVVNEVTMDVLEQGSWCVTQLAAPTPRLDVCGTGSSLKASGSFFRLWLMAASPYAGTASVVAAHALVLASKAAEVYFREPLPQPAVCEACPPFWADSGQLSRIETAVTQPAAFWGAGVSSSEGAEQFARLEAAALQCPTAAAAVDEHRAALAYAIGSSQWVWIGVTVLCTLWVTALQYCCRRQGLSPSNGGFSMERAAPEMQTGRAFDPSDILHGACGAGALSGRPVPALGSPGVEAPGGRDLPGSNRSRRSLPAGFEHSPTTPH